MMHETHETWRQQSIPWNLCDAPMPNRLTLTVSYVARSTYLSSPLGLAESIGKPTSSLVQSLLVWIIISALMFVDHANQETWLLRFVRVLNQLVPMIPFCRFWLVQCSVYDKIDAGGSRKSE